MPVTLSRARRHSDHAAGRGDAALIGSLATAGRAIRRRWCRLALPAVATLCVANGARAQSNNGALDLLLPIGARATSMGAAYTAEEGSEAVWWNPAGIARLTKPELRLDHFVTFLVEGGDAVALILPAAPVGTFGISARLFNYGTSPATDRSTGAEVGISTQRSYTVGGTFATTFGPLWTGGIAFRLYSLGSPCTGLCTNTVSGSFNTATVDLGAHYRLSASSPIVLGATLSNLGPDLQVHDRPQADALPARIRLGASVQIPTSQWDPNLRMRVTADFVATPALSSGELHAGTELSYSSAGTSLFARAGYVRSDAASAGPSIGFGLANARLQLDFARVFESFSTGLGKPPTYISIRIGL